MRLSTNLALLAATVVLLAACGSASPATTCDSDCQDATAQQQRLADFQAGIAEHNDEENNIQETLAIEAKTLTEAQQRAEIDKVIAFDKCVTVDVEQAGAAAVHSCYEQLLAAGFGSVR